MLRLAALVFAIFAIVAVLVGTPVSAHHGKYVSSNDARVVALEARVAALEATVTSLDTRLDALES